MPTVHLPFGGSTAARTLNCPGWYKASEGVERTPAGPAAVEGSMHHEIMEMCFRDGKPPAGYVGHVYEEGDGRTREFKKEDYPLSKKAYDTTNALLDELDIDEFMVEPFVQYVEDISGGSIDLLGLSADRKTALVLDHKFGRHIVSAERNAQGLKYAISAMRDPLTKDLFDEVEQVVCAIVQPQSKNGLSRWTANMKTVGYFKDDWDAALGLAQSEDPPLANSIGDYCKYCPKAPTCPVARKQAGALSQLTVKTDNELAAAAADVLAIEQWCKDVKEAIYLNLSKGVAVPGWKLVNKRATRKWIDPKAAEEFLKKKRVAQKHYRNNSFRTAPQLVDILKAEGIDINLDDFIEKKSSGTTAAPVDDEAEGVELTQVPENLAKHVAKNT